ncbi:ATP-grasp domain-containing protein [Faecalispora jeddahensis]|uniref:ATP-grasp domain-containing protein n=1 Tax=Faecalispora jeddahensis TaxID=1414721 RepID=UPI00145BA169|nr:ATP-grasp domain-containing protein [Faecalispora jeddahensis]
MKQVRILIFPCGSEVGLELHQALKDISFITLIGASSVPDHGQYMFEHYCGGLPFVQTPDFLERFNALLKAQHIDFIYSAMDEVLDVLSANREQLAASLIAPCHETVHICRSKVRTYARLNGLDFVPKVYNSPDQVTRFPVIIKPEEGYGAKGFYILQTPEALRQQLAESKTANVICEYLQGEEYTVDCFTNRHGVLQYTSCRNRNRIRNGISVNSRLQPPDEKIGEIAQQISARIPMRGAWFFQLKRDEDGNCKLLEVATRVAGTMCIQRAVGVNLPLLSVFDMMNYDVAVTPQLDTVEVDRALYNAYHLPIEFDEVYLDFDDTVIVHDKVNLNLMRYLYQCVNKNIPVKLLTKHDYDINITLKRYKIAPELFDEIIHTDRAQRKCDFIRPGKRALFIDDSFAERKQMQEAHGMVTLGVDAVEALLDYRQ